MYLDPLSVSEPLTLSCMRGFLYICIKFGFLLLISLMSIWLLGQPEGPWIEETLFLPHTQFFSWLYPEHLERTVPGTIVGSLVGSEMF